MHMHRSNHWKHKFNRPLCQIGQIFCTYDTQTNFWMFLEVLKLCKFERLNWMEAAPKEMLHVLHCVLRMCLNVCDV